MKKVASFTLFLLLAGCLGESLWALSLPPELSPNTQAQELYQSAGNFFEARDYSHAASQYQEFLDHYEDAPGTLEAMMMLAESLDIEGIAQLKDDPKFAAKTLKQAEKAYDKVSGRAPSGDYLAESARFRLGELAFNLGKYDEARADMDRLPKEIIKSNVFEPGISISSKAIVPLHLWIARPWLGEPAHIFHPRKILTSAHAFKEDREERKKSTWDLDVVDSEGKSFRHFSGRGLVPERLVFDGKSDAGKWIAAGETYMGVLKATDSKGPIHTAYGRSFKLAGISLKENGVFLVSLDAGVLFSTTSARPRFSPFGQELMAEGAQLLQRYYPGFAVDVDLQDDRFDAARIQEATLLCAKDVAKRLLKRSSDVKTQWTEKVSGVEATLNLSVHYK